MCWKRLESPVAWSKKDSIRLVQELAMPTIMGCSFDVILFTDLANHLPQMRRKLIGIKWLNLIGHRKTEIATPAHCDMILQ